MILMIYISYKILMIYISECAKNLGVIFQSNMSMDKHISSVVKTCFYQLREFRHIRSFIPKSAAIIFANAFIYSCIDYCNSLFYGSKYSINRLQKIQNSVARIVTRNSRSSHITPVLKSLHWLSVQCCINFKLCCITHRALSLEEPHYLNSLLIHRLNSHSLRSSFFNPLTLPFFNKKSNGFRSLNSHSLRFPSFFNPLTLPFFNKNQMVFTHLLMMHNFFGTIYLTLFDLHLHTYLFEKASKHISLMKHFPHRLCSQY